MTVKAIRHTGNVVKSEDGGVDIVAQTKPFSGTDSGSRGHGNQTVSF